MKYIFPILIFLSGCMVGPKYQSPEMAMPTAFEEKGESVGGDGDLTQWWKQFDDPVLDGLIAEALEANYDLRVAIEKIEQTRAQYRIERSHLWPEIDLNATATRTRISQNLLPAPPKSTGGTGFLPTFLNIFQVGFDAIWEFDLFGKFRHAKKAANYLWEASKEDAQSVLLSVVSEVAVNYTNIRALQKKIELAKSRVDADEQEVLIAESLFAIGLDNEMQIAAIVSTLESDRAILPVLETSLQQSIYSLAYLLGRQPEGLAASFEESGSIPRAVGRSLLGCLPIFCAEGPM